MNLKSLLLAAPLALAACGGTDAAHTMSSGYYTGSDSHAVAGVTDQCLVGTIYNGGYDLPWLVASDGRSAGINLTSVDDLAHTMGVAIDGNALTSTKTATYTKVVTGVDATDCTYNVTTTVLSGELVDDRTIHLVLRYDAAEVVAGSCSAVELDATQAGSCSSQVDFLGARNNNT